MFIRHNLPCLAGHASTGYNILFSYRSCSMVWRYNILFVGWLCKCYLLQVDNRVHGKVFRCELFCCLIILRVPRCLRDLKEKYNEFTAHWLPSPANHLAPWMLLRWAVAYIYTHRAIKKIYISPRVESLLLRVETRLGGGHLFDEFLCRKFI